MPAKAPMTAAREGLVVRGKRSGVDSSAAKIAASAPPEVAALLRIRCGMVITRKDVCGTGERGHNKTGAPNTRRVGRPGLLVKRELDNPLW